MTMIFSLVLIALAAESSARFEAADGTVRDATTALVWTQKDNGADIDLAGATAYCDGLSLAGHDDWRLATIEQLAALYDDKVSSPPTYLYRGKPYPLRMDPAFQLTAPGVWSSSMRYAPRVAWSFFFSSGRQLATAANMTNYQRAICVRGG